MRVSNDLRRTVVFIGHEDTRPGRGGIDCVGTGFLLGHESVGYLVTVRHLADSLGTDPFLVRVNKNDGTAENVLADEVDWHFHPDETVDVALTQITFGSSYNFDSLYLPSRLAVTDAGRPSDQIGIGDLTYTVGLFRLMAGQQRNLPVVHFGTIAMIPG